MHIVSVELERHAHLTPALGEVQWPASCLGKRTPGNCWTAGCMGVLSRLDIADKRETFVPVGKSNQFPSR